MPFKRTGPETTAIPTEPRVMKEDGKYVYRSPSESPNADLIYRTPLHNPLRRSDTESDWPVENPFLVDLLKKADWSFQMSDSHKVYERGTEELYLLKHHAAEHAKQSTEHAEWVSRAWDTARRNASSEVFEGYPRVTADPHPHHQHSPDKLLAPLVPPTIRKDDARYAL